MAATGPSPQAALAKAIPRRMQVSWWIGLAMAVGFALVLLPAITAERWIAPSLHAGEPAPYTVRVPQFAGVETPHGHITGGGILNARGEQMTAQAEDIETTQPRGAIATIAWLLLVSVLAGLFTHHMRRSGYGRLLRVQLFSLGVIAVAAIAVKIAMLMTSVSVLVVPVAVFAMVPTLALDRVVGLATGTLAALVVALLVPFDVGVAIVLLVQVAVAGLVIHERPKRLLLTVAAAGAASTACCALIYPLLTYLTTGAWPAFGPSWAACAIGPALATAIAPFAMPLYQLMVGEITHGKLVALEDLSHPLLRQIAEKAPGTWQHSLMMANMAEIAANAIGANGRLVRVGAYYHDLGKSLQPKYFIENLEPGETSPHDKLPPEVSCDAIFAHVTEGIVTARRAGLHERIVDFMHMHHGNGVLEYFWAKCKEQGNPRGLSIENFRYPGVPPQSRETAILAICDAVEAASRTLKKPDAASIDSLVQRIVYGKLHLGQLDESGLSMRDLRRIADSLRETIRHANHGRIEYPWQKAQQDASATPEPVLQTGPRLDSLDRPAKADVIKPAAKIVDDAIDTGKAEALADTANATPNLRGRNSDEIALMVTAPVEKHRPSEEIVTQPVAKEELDSIGPLIDPPKAHSGVVTDSVEEDTGRRRKQPMSEEVAAFAAAARHALDDVSRDAKKIETKQIETKQPDFTPVAPEAADTQPSMPAAEKPTPAARKRAATLPPGAFNRPPTIPPPMTTLPPPSSLRQPAAIVMTESTDGVMKIEPDAAATQPRMEKSADKSASEWAQRIAAKLDAEDFGTDTPTRAPTRAELQALRDFPPDPTRKQSIDELEALHAKSKERNSEPELFARRAHPTAEVTEDDIEAAIELAPQARKGAVGVAKKKPE
jgi:cyclic-di-AMP phosphodiesterase PgpH